jgi:hypothetical protein
MLLADLAREIQAVFLAKAEVERDQRDRLPFEAGAQFRTILGIRDGEPLPFEASPKEGSDLGVVIYDKDVPAVHQPLRRKGPLQRPIVLPAVAKIPYHVVAWRCKMGVFLGKPNVTGT